MQRKVYEIERAGVLTTHDTPVRYQVIAATKAEGLYRSTMTWPGTPEGLRVATGFAQQLAQRKESPMGTLVFGGYWE